MKLTPVKQEPNTFGSLVEENGKFWRTVNDAVDLPHLAYPRQRFNAPGLSFQHLTSVEYQLIR